MGERGSIFQTVQVGVEAAGSPGVAVAANRKLQSLGIAPGPKAEVSSFRPMGTKFPTLTALGKEWVEAKLTGKPTYSELIYALVSVMDGSASGSSLGGSPAAYEWTFEPSATAEDSYRTLTVEQGDATYAHRFANGLITGLKFNFNRGEAGVEGSMIGAALENGITMTAAPTSIELIPILPKQVKIYLDDAYGSLGSTALTRPLSVSWEIAERFGPLWALNSDYSSYATVVETEPKLTSTLKMEADTVGMGLLATMRSGATKFMRIEAIGDTISGLNKYRLRLDTALKVSDVSEFSDEDGVFAIEWTFAGVYDADWGKACQAALVNKQSAL